jgi:hypothetical protein
MGRRTGGRVTLLTAPPGSTFAAEAQWRGLFVFQTAEVQFDDSSPPQRLSAGTLCWSAAPGVRAAPRREQAAPPWRLIAGDQAFWLAKVRKHALARRPACHLRGGIWVGADRGRRAARRGRPYRMAGARIRSAGNRYPPPGNRPGRGIGHTRTDRSAHASGLRR